MQSIMRVCLLFLLVCCLTGCSNNMPPIEENTSTETSQKPPVLTGWQNAGGEQFYLLEDGSRATGWLELGEDRYYFNETGILQTGWLELDGERFYLRADGTMARGKTVIDGKSFFFTSQGAPILLVNPWNPIPDGYEPDLVPISSSVSYAGRKIDRHCHDPLMEMITDCKEQTGSKMYIVSAYRDHETQTINFNKEVQSFISAGYSREDALVEAAKSVAVPGTSEHQLGLAVDIIDTKLWKLSAAQADLPGQQWLMENCWRYGFILRYPENKTDVTGIIYEPWHYRYVGTKVAAELHESGMTLEEYLDSLTRHM